MSHVTPVMTRRAQLELCDSFLESPLALRTKQPRAQETVVTHRIIDADKLPRVFMTLFTQARAEPRSVINPVHSHIVSIPF